jgi:hypothetical protein
LSKGIDMTEEIKTPEIREDVAEPKEMTQLERIKLLGDLANGVQNENIMNVIKSLPSGDIMYDVFVAAISKHLDDIMTPVKAASKTLIDAVSMTNDLNKGIANMYVAVESMSRSPLMTVLGLLHQNMGGQPYSPTQQQQPLEPQQPESFKERQRQILAQQQDAVERKSAVPSGSRRTQVEGNW